MLTVELPHQHADLASYEVVGCNVCETLPLRVTADDFFSLSA